MRFPYHGYPVPSIGGTGQTLVYRPMAQIRIFGPVGDAIALGLCDTGADDTLLPDSFLSALGVVIPATTATIAGISGAITVRFATVDLELSRGKTVVRWSARVGFYNGFKTILGHSGVLEHFVASFNHRRRHVTLRLNGVLPAPIHATP
jgi:Retroviral aspartyl protease